MAFPAISTLFDSVPLPDLLKASGMLTINRRRRGLVQRSPAIALIVNANRSEPIVTVTVTVPAVRERMR
jgi:hypothetical protein